MGGGGCGGEGREADENENPRKLLTGNDWPFGRGRRRTSREELSIDFSRANTSRFRYDIFPEQTLRSNALLLPVITRRYVRTV